MMMIAFILPFIVAFIGTISVGYPFLRFARTHFSSRVRPYTPDGHQQKNGTPTMGGLLLVVMITGLNGIYFGYSNPLVILINFCVLSFSLLGAWDDWRKITNGNGINAQTKFALQLILAFITVLIWLALFTPSLSINIPMVNRDFQIGWLIIPWAIFVIIACVNAVNLTDGLDGLAIWCLIPNFLVLAIFSYTVFSTLSSICIIILGVLLGFAWFNSYPAQLFMGDIGSLSLGALLGIIALIAHVELFIPLTAIVFVVEVLSVIIQIGSYKIRKKRIFKMAPLHHHFELAGISEPKIVSRAFIITCVLCCIALSLG
jgi:phospho-N-acetylmuramoyl-pentapeptide-transferase